MPKVIESRNLTKEEADTRAQDCRDDNPPATDVQVIKQPVPPGGPPGDDKFTVICTYDDPAPAPGGNGNAKAGQ
jgi:hypothetical protein